MVYLALFATYPLCRQRCNIVSMRAYRERRNYGSRTGEIYCLCIYARVQAHAARISALRSRSIPETGSADRARKRRLDPIFLNQMNIIARHREIFGNIYDVSRVSARECAAAVERKMQKREESSLYLNGPRDYAIIERSRRTPRIFLLICGGEGKEVKKLHV